MRCWRGAIVAIAVTAVIACGDDPAPPDAHAPVEDARGDRSRATADDAATSVDAATTSDAPTPFDPRDAAVDAPRAAIGADCATAGACASGFCVDGVCCQSACALPCHSCRVPASRGRCELVANGAAARHGECPDEGAASCGRSGLCDGAGGCRLHSLGTLCAPARCRDGHTLSAASVCDGAGRCVPGPDATCRPFDCVGDRCVRACDCAKAPVDPTCLGVCGFEPLLPGSSCSDANICSSRHCQQGVCCASACGGACSSCALPGSLGKCAPVPRGMRSPTADGCTCDGAGACLGDGGVNDDGASRD